MTVAERTFCIDYIYGPYVGRRCSSALTKERAVELLWDELRDLVSFQGPLSVPIPTRYRKVTKIVEI